MTPDQTYTLLTEIVAFGIPLALLIMAILAFWMLRDTARIGFVAGVVVSIGSSLAAVLFSNSGLLSAYPYTLPLIIFDGVIGLLIMLAGLYRSFFD